MGAYCNHHECLLAELLRSTGCGRPSQGFPESRIFGFEPNARNLQRTLSRVAALPRRWRRCLRLTRAAVANASLAHVPLFGVGGKSSLRPGAYVGKKYVVNSDGIIATFSDSHLEHVPVVRLSDWAARQRPPVLWIEILKVDVEGSEVDVVAGTEPLIQEQRVGVLILEYSHFWPAFEKEQTSRNGMNLQRMAEYMTKRGYDGYFIGSRTLIPFSGPHMELWDDLYEVCADPGSNIYRGLSGWCWLNVAFFLRGGGSWGRNVVEHLIPWSVIPEEHLRGEAFGVG